MLSPVCAALHFLAAPCFVALRAADRRRFVADDDDLGVACGSTISVISRRTCLHYACDAGFMDVAAALIHAGADATGQDAAGLDPLVLSFEHGDLELCKLLHAQEGSDIERRDMVGYTALRHACHFQRADIVGWLLENDANVNSRDNWAEPPLHWAVSKRRGDAATVIELMIAAGAVVNAVKIGSGTLLDKLESQECSHLGAELLPLLRQRGALTTEELHSQPGVSAPLCSRSVQRVCSALGCSEGEAGLTLYAHKCRIDMALAAAKHPSPGQPVSWEECARTKWHSGIVRRGPDWPYGDEVDGGDGFVGYMNLVRGGICKVRWPRAQQKQWRTMEFDFSDRGSFKGKEVLVFAEYRPAEEE